MSQTEQDIALRKIQVWVCDLCLGGEGGECHVPGCAFWCHDAPAGDAVAWWQGMRERTPSDRQEPTREQWADWFRRCVDKGQDIPAGEQRGLRLAAAHLEAHEVMVKDGKITYLIGDH